MFSTNVIDIIGQFTFGFTAHDSICQIMRSNEQPRNNTRDIKMGFFLAMVIYSFIGIFGALSIVGI